MGMVNTTSGRINHDGGRLEKPVNEMTREELLEEIQRLRQDQNRITVNNCVSEDAYAPTPATNGFVPFIPVDTLRKMLIRENELRLSQETQARYADAETRWDIDWMLVTEELQHQVVQEFGFQDRMDEALYSLRCAHIIHPDQADFKTFPLYVKYNRAKDGTIVEGLPAPDTKAFTLDGKEVSLLDHQKDGKALVLVGGSYS